VIVTILACVRFRKDAFAVGLHIMAAYQLDLVRQSGGHHCALAGRQLWRDPARPRTRLHAAQLVGAVLATWLFGWLLVEELLPATASDLT
jgi:hypothetical protein